MLGKLLFVCLFAGVTAVQVFWIYTCVNSSLLHSFPFRMPRGLCFSPKKWNSMGLVVFGLVVALCLPPILFPQLLVKQRMLKNIKLPLQSSNKRCWIRITTWWLQKEVLGTEGEQAALCWLLEQSVGCSHACISVPGGSHCVPVELKTWSIINLVTNSAERQSEVVLLFSLYSFLRMEDITFKFSHPY